jgi:hypothetical protein
MLYGFLSFFHQHSCVWNDSKLVIERNIKKQKKALNNQMHDRRYGMSAFVCP